jgi:uncharacterized protein YbcI
MATTHQDRQNGATRTAISNMLVRLHVEHAGRGPTKARTFLNEDIITSVLEDALTPVEQTLAGDGQAETVERVRHKLQKSMRDDMVRQLETITGRRVRVFLSANELDPDVAVETFLLEPIDPAGEQRNSAGEGEARTPIGRDVEPGTNRPAPRPAF